MNDNLRIYNIAIVLAITFITYCSDCNTNKDNTQNNLKKLKNNVVTNNNDNININHIVKLKEIDNPTFNYNLLKQEYISNNDCKHLHEIAKNNIVEITINNKDLKVTFGNDTGGEKNIDFDILKQYGKNIIFLKIKENVIINNDYVKLSFFNNLMFFEDYSGQLNDQNSSFMESLPFLKEIFIFSNSIGFKTMKRLSEKKYLDHVMLGTDLDESRFLSGLSGSISLKVLDLSSSKNVNTDVLEIILTLNLPNLEVVLIPEEHLTNVTLKEAIYYDKLFHKRFPKFNMLTHVEFPEYPESEDEK